MTALAITLAVVCAEAPPDAGGFVGYLEWMIDVGVTQGQREEVQGLVAQAWTKKDPFEMRLVLRGAELEKDLANYTQAERDGLRSSVEDEYFKTLKHRGKGLPLAAWITALRAAARTAIAPGEPPLTRQASDALAEVSLRVVSNGSAAGGRPFKDAFARTLASTYPRLSVEQRAAVAAAPRAWARFRKLSPADQDARALQWRSELAVGADGGAAASSDPRVLAASAGRVAERLAASK